MKKTTLKLTIAALAGALAVTGCTVSVPPPGGGGGGIIIDPPPGDGGGYEPPAPEQPSILLQASSFYSGRDSSGKRIRAFVTRSGEIIRVDSKTGSNFSQTYRYMSGNTYRSRGDRLTVTSSRSFIWNGPFGQVVMND